MEKINAGEAEEVEMRVQLPSGRFSTGNHIEGYYADEDDFDAAILTRFKPGDLVRFGLFKGCRVVSVVPETCHCAACEGFV